MGKRLEKRRQRTPEQEALLKRVRFFYALRRMRISCGNQIDAMLRQDLCTEEEAEAFKADWVKPKLAEEGKLSRQLGKHVKGMPIWDEWLQHVAGITAEFAVRMIALLQPISDFDTVSKVWAYAGLHVIDGEAARRKAGQQSNWSDDLKTMCYLLGTNFVRSGKAYRRLYETFKAVELAKHPEPVEMIGPDGKPVKDRNGKPRIQYTKGHLDARAKRHTVKIFLSHLWHVWREMEGFPVRAPYVIEYGGHTTLMSPWDFVETAAPEEEAA